MSTTESYVAFAVFVVPVGFFIAALTAMFFKIGGPRHLAELFGFRR